MRYEVLPFTEEHLEQAVDLFVDCYQKEKEKSPLLPDRVVKEPEWIQESIKNLIENPGVGILENNRLIAYMLTGFYFPFKGQEAVLVPERCHASVLKDKKRLYQSMYMNLAEEWAKDGKHIHIMGHFAHDTELKETLYELGFGAFLAERLRDFSPVSELKRKNITEEKDYRKLIDIHVEHMNYYTDSPIFISKEEVINNVNSDLESHITAGDSFIVYYEDGRPCAYFILGVLAEGSEGFLLRDTSTAQIKAAYIQPDMRGKGIGEALLQYSVDWSQEHGFERLFVEHETANYFGGNFWGKYLNPYLYYSLRYIDNTIKY